MAPIAKEPEVSSQPGAAKPQPAAVEIPVTVNGARTVEGTDKREPFSEHTQTVLVFANGAVIRLSSAVSSGQLLFLTNEKSKKEVVCQVVKSKNDRNVSGYVELEFTEAAPGFWGMRFPGTTPPAAAKPSPAVLAPSMKSLEEKLAEVKAIAPVASSLKPADNAVASLSAPIAVPAKPAEAPKDLKAAPLVPAQPLANASKIPSLSEFLTQGANGSELKAPEKAKPNQAPEAAKPSGANSPTALPKLPSDSDNNDLASRLNLAPAPANPNPAPGSSTFDFAADEVKIPAWLEPLARNSATITEFKAPELKASEPIFFEPKPGEIHLPETPGVESEAKVSDAVTLATGLVGSSEQQAADLTLSSEGPTPNFGSSLPLDGRSNSSQSFRSGKGLIFGLLATGLLLAAGGWYWYSNQPTNVSANGTVPSGPNNFGGSAPSSASDPAQPVTTSAETPSFANRNSVPSQINSSAPASGNNSDRSAVPAEKLVPRSLPVVEPLPAAVKKPSVGEIHLAAPVVNRNMAKESSGTADLAPAFSSSGLSPESGELNLLASKGKQPTAPVPVGGDVKQARLLSSVPPVYPSLARNQRLSGNVVIDALIDTTGRVSAMKVLSGPALLHQSAMEAVRQWRYQPATLNGQPMAMHLTVTVQFKLQ
jgi:periplasmic protein TonB